MLKVIQANELGEFQQELKMRFGELCYDFYPIPHKKMKVEAIYDYLRLNYFWFLVHVPSGQTELITTQSPDASDGMGLDQKESPQDWRLIDVTNIARAVYANFILLLENEIGEMYNPMKGLWYEYD